MKICVLPTTPSLGIGRVVEAYRKYLPGMGVEFVADEADADLLVCNAGMQGKTRQTDVHVCHGLYPTATVDNSAPYYEANASVIQNAREALVITVPSSWVAMPFKRDMGLSPHVVPHGINLQEWQMQTSNDEYILWAKGHTPGVCNTDVVNGLAERHPNKQFVSTFGKATANVKITGALPFIEMKKVLSKASVYMATTKETFGIQTLEAMACGVPVIGYNHGATPEIVSHGVDGWLAEPGDLAGLSQGLEWALKNRRALGQAAREKAAQFTWEAACAKFYDVLKIAEAVKYIKEPLVSVIIPCYNYGRWVGQAIESVLKQTYKGEVEIIVVDDGSIDNTEQAVKPYAGKVTYFKKPNGGVAEARNYGIRHSSGNLIACLDADDRWEPNFLERLVPPMLRDRSLGLVYGHLESDNGNGRHRSDWPPKFDFRQQAIRHNCVPSSCLFRRSAWARAGGYKAKYTPAEDAELWLTIAAAGYNVRKVTEETTYIYRLHNSSLSRTNKEPDWVVDKPYSKNADLTPFAAPVSGGKASYPFRDYDDPWVSVIIPVGPGHENLVYRAVNSVKLQTLPNWEVIVVNDSGDEMRHPGTGRLLRDQYPFITEINNGPGCFGVAFSRNRGAEAAKSGLLVWLDADDELSPSFLSYTVQAYNDNPCNYIYTDWIGLDSEKVTPRFAKDFTVAGILKEAIHPITALVPKAWHQEVGGFDESVAGWEDWIYYLDMVKAGHCGYRCPIHGMVYDYSSGKRRDDSLNKRNQLLPLIRKRYKETDMACSSCGKRSGGNAHSNSVVVPAASTVSTRGVPVMATKSVEGANDNAMVAVVENSGNIGAHGIVGVRTRINYGRHKHGDVFMMHTDDQKAQPQRYVRTQVNTVDPSPAKPEAPIPASTQVVEPVLVGEPKPTRPVFVEAAAAPPTAVDTPVLEKAATPVPDDEIEVDITILPLVQIKQLGLGPEDAVAALELEMSAKKPRQSVIDYLKSIAK